MGIWSRLFGSDNVVNKAVDGIYNGVDYAVYTDQEKAEELTKRMSVKAALLKAYEPFKIAQRLIALIVGFPFVVIHLIVMLVWLLSIFMFDSPERYNFIFEQLRLISEWNNNTLGEPFGYIVIFYFLGGASEGAIRAISSRKNK